MNKHDIFILNRALDGKQIYGLPNFDKMHISQILIDIYKEGMIRRGLLEDKNHLSTEGAIMVSRMKDYKECETFVSLNNLTIGIKDTGRNISLMYNPYNDEYYFSPVELPKDYAEILNSYPFFRNVIGSENSFVGKFSKKDFEAKYGPIKRDVLHLVTHSKNEELSYTVFVKDEKAYLYDNQNGSLSIVGRCEIIDKIKGEFSNE
ncbi:MAG: DUF5081 family protein [Pseudobutyrivibrio sp.]|uniref:DUF5081 family protein n=1 Tax=Pseudobutyrivibrio sp. TaxID=2014367 RepID=UPI0025DFFDDC|nr:DUF5081 family protein [Pseudobutyrivibrio sp.]MBQ6464600.1 DUF5081 family protein [Pseudobutyrivibrio sp.]